ncbi:MAG: hypothetical protein WKF85_15640 [Chitinophagaceae bacterium]
MTKARFLMSTKAIELIDEQTSPLFRIMFIHNMNEPARRHFDNNICAFHIGQGLILSVAHNLKMEAQILKSIPQGFYTADILPHLTPVQITLFERCYPLDPTTNKRYVNIVDQNDVQAIIDLLKQINFDTRWLTLMQRDICKPYLIIQFTENQFYNDLALTAHFNAGTYFPEPGINKHTFLVEVELVEAFYKEDMSLYRIINTHQDIINSLPVIVPDFTILDDN